MRVPHGPSRVRRLLLAGLAAVLCTGCQARLSLEVVVDREGAGELAVVLGADAELLAQAAEAGADPLGDLAATGEELAADGWRVGDETDAGGGRTVRLTREFASPDDLAELADELAEALAAPELVPLEDLRVAVEDDLVRLTGVAGLVPTDEVTALGVQPEQAVELLRDAEAVVYEVVATMPGPVLEANADGDDRVLTWRIEPGERVELQAVAERPRGTWWPIAAGGALGGLLTLALLYALRRPRGAHAARSA